MRTCLFLFASVWLGNAASTALAQPGEELPILETFQGAAAKDKQPELKTGFVAAEGDWKEIWAKVNQQEKLPEVDFGKHFLLVERQDAADPNRRSAAVAKDEEGIVTVTIHSTLIGFESSDRTIYRFHKVSREGVTGVKRFDAKQKKRVVDPLPK
jgi:hypothetical protein